MNVDQIQFDKRVPFAQWQLVTVTFTAADTDQDIQHSLKPTRPDDIRYIPIRQSAAGSIYEDMTGARQAWQRNLIYLRASAAMTVDLLLVVLPT
jgi:hypothetical protein